MSRTPVPANSSELEEMLAERDERLGEVTREYIASQTEVLKAQVNEQVQLGMAEFLRANGGDGTKADTAAAIRAAEAVSPQARRSKLYSPAAIGAQLDSEPFAASMGSFLKAVRATKTENTDEVKAFRATIKNAMSERVPSEGGFLVPESLRSEMLMVALEHAIVRPRARVIPMDSLRVPYPTIDDTTHTSSVYGGVIGYWTEEGAALTASQPSFGRIVLEAKKLTGYTEIPNELLEDSITALDQWFREMFPTALAWFEDVAFIGGGGTGEPQGFLNSPCAIPVSRNTASHVKFQDIVAMYPRMLPASLNSAVWVCSPQVIGELLSMAMPTGDTTTTYVAPPLWLQGQSAHGGVDYTLLGRPLIVSEKMSALGTKGDLAFVDFGYYLLGDRQSMQIANSDEYKFANDLTAFRVIERLDGRTWIQSAITPENGGSTLSPVVVLN